MDQTVFLSIYLSTKLLYLTFILDCRKKVSKHLSAIINGTANQSESLGQCLIIINHNSKTLTQRPRERGKERMAINHCQVNNFCVESKHVQESITKQKGNPIPDHQQDSIPYVANGW